MYLMTQDVTFSILLSNDCLQGGFLCSSDEDWEQYSRIQKEFLAKVEGVFEEYNFQKNQSGIISASTIYESVSYS